MVPTGTNTYFVNKMANGFKMSTNVWEWGSVSPGQFPANDLTAGQLCWLAFASPKYLTNGGGPLPLEAFQQNGNDLHYDVGGSNHIALCPSTY